MTSERNMTLLKLFLLKKTNEDTRFRPFGIFMFSNARLLGGHNMSLVTWPATTDCEADIIDFR